MKGYECIAKALRSGGFNLDEREDKIYVRYNDLTYTIVKDDSSCVQIALVFDMDENLSVATALVCSNEMNNNKFIVKTTVMINSREIWFNYEFMPEEYVNTQVCIEIFNYLTTVKNEFYGLVSQLGS